MRAPLALADREVGPEPPSYQPGDDHVRAWHFWRAVRRDAYPTPAELDARHDAFCWALERRAQR